MKKLFTLLVLLIALTARSQVTINVVGVPANTPPGDDIYIAGTFNNWDPGNSAYKLVKINSTFFTITLASGNGTIEFKFTRGDWARGECKSDGSFQPNRSFSY